MMILGVGLLIVIAVALGIYFGLFYNQENVTAQKSDEQTRALIELIQNAVTQSTKFIE